MGLSEDLLLQALNGLREDVQGVRAKQDSMEAELHSNILATSTRVQTLESGFRSLKKDVRKEARRWGAIGGACASAAAIVVAIIKALLGGFKLPHG